MKTRRRSVRAAGALLLALSVSTCSERAAGPQPGANGPQFHSSLNFTPDTPEAEWVAICKVGPSGTYTFHAKITAGVGEPGNPRTAPTTGANGTGNPILVGDTDLDGNADYQITVTDNDVITFAGNTVQGACLETAGTHSDVALVGGPSVTIELSETALPSGTEFVKTDVYSSVGPPTGETITASLGLGNPVSVVVGGNEGANAIFYNQLIAQPSLGIVKTADAASVPAGGTIGFSITVASNGPGTAKNVHLSDPLPMGTGISWSINPTAAGCAIVNNTLDCSLGDMAANTSFSVHVSSATSFQSCGDYPNTATATADNHAAVTASASTSVDCPEETPCPSGSFMYTFLSGSGDLYIKYDQFPAPNDNSYGINAVGWQNGHKFGDLVGSDHAGFQLSDANGVIRLQFNVDYLTADATAPSGYLSKGVLGGDGKMLIGTSTGISATTSLANNLNNINIPGLFSASHVQQFGSVNVLVNSPPTDAAHQTYNNSDAALAGWDFHNTYYVTISAAKLASIGFDANTWKVEPSPTQLHNSPAKVCPVVAGPCSLAATKYEVKDKQVKITVANTGASDTYLTEVSLNWPELINGKLMQVKLDGDVVYDKPDIAGGSAVLTLSQLVADQNKRKITHGKSRVLNFVFEKNADKDLTHYTSKLTFGSCDLTVLPR